MKKGEKGEILKEIASVYEVYSDKNENNFLCSKKWRYFGLSKVTNSHFVCVQGIQLKFSGIFASTFIFCLPNFRASVIKHAC